MLIGFTGEIGAGKSTAAEWLVSYRGYKQKSYAEPLKKAASIMTGLSIEHFYNKDLKGIYVEWLGMTPRRFLQLLGTEFARRMILKDFWITRMRRELLSPEWDIRCGYNIAVDDVRFQNEVDLIHEFGGKVIRIDNMNAGEDGDHESEKMEILTDVTFDNNGSFAALHDQIRVYLEEIS